MPEYTWEVIAIKDKLKENLRLYAFLALSGGLVYFAVLLGGNISGLYLWLLLPGTVFGFISYLEYSRIEKLKLLTQLRREWGVEHLKKNRNFEEIPDLFNQAQRADSVLDNRTWHDLNMDLIFSRIDRTFTWPGVQRLYQILRSPEIDNLDEIEKRTTVISGFETDSKQREVVQAILNRMDTRIGSGLACLLWHAPDVRPVYPLWLFRALSFLALLSPLLLFMGPRYIVFIILIFQVNMYFHFKVQKEIRSYFEGVRSLRQLIRVSTKLSSLNWEPLDDLLTRISVVLGKVEGFTKIVRFVGLETTDPLLSMFQQYVTIFYLAEVRGFYRALDFIEENSEALQDLFMAVGEIDALQSVASYRASLDYYCEPQFTQKPFLHLEAGYHPLLSEPVPNSIKVSDRGILVTGSNMSGKSTFLRMVGLNALLAQSIATCPAMSYQGSPVRLLTSIGRSDNVVEGKSYYLEEALSVLRILDVLSAETVTLVIFDELYRGTNSEERIFAAQRVLEYLVRRNALIFVATHDLELHDLLKERYDSLHFNESVGNLGLEFDYKLKKGPATTKNAIALLRYLGYPEEITDQS